MNKVIGKLMLGMFVVFAILLSGCDDILNDLEKSSEDTEDKEDDIEITLEKLNEASTIKAKKSLFSIGDEWTIFADNEDIGVIKGEAIYLIGDTYSFYTSNGFLVERESENLKVATRAAGIYSNEDEEIGYIKQSIVSLNDF